MENNLTNMAAELKREAHSLRAAVSEVDRRRKKSIASVWAVIIAVLMAISLNIYIGYQNNKTLRIVKDATDPKGQIYKRSQQDTAKAISRLICDNHRLHGDPNPTNIVCP